MVRKKDMVIKPVKNVFFTDGNLVFYYVWNQAAYRLPALYLASRWIQMPMSIVQNEK